jgi:hypothetical protein
MADPLNPLNRDPDAAVTVNWDSGLILLQIRAGLDCASELSGKSAEDNLWNFARSNANLIYLIGDVAAGEAVAVDAAFDVAGVRDIAKQSGFELIGSLYTHRHFDHCGGKVAESFINRPGVRMEGAAEIVLCRSSSASTSKKILISGSTCSSVNLIMRETVLPWCCLLSSFVPVAL